MDIIVPNIIKACCVTSVSTKPFALSWSKYLLTMVKKSEVFPAAVTHAQITKTHSNSLFRAELLFF